MLWFLDKIVVSVRMFSRHVHVTELCSEQAWPPTSLAVISAPLTSQLHRKYDLEQCPHSLHDHKTFRYVYIWRVCLGYRIRKLDSIRVAYLSKFLYYLLNIFKYFQESFNCRRKVSYLSTAHILFNYELNSLRL